MPHKTEVEVRTWGQVVYLRVWSQGRRVGHWDIKTGTEWKPVQVSLSSRLLLCVNGAQFSLGPAEDPCRTCLGILALETVKENIYTLAPIPYLSRTTSLPGLARHHNGWVSPCSRDPKWWWQRGSGQKVRVSLLSWDRWGAAGLHWP